MARDLKRLSMNMSADILDQVDEFALRMGMNRSAAINMLIVTALEQKNAFVMMDEMLRLVKTEKMEKAISELKNN